MPFCIECGNSYPDEGKFCPHCGEPNKLLNKVKIPILEGTNGSTLKNGRYAILEKLGDGDFGVVYKVSDAKDDGKTKALKIIYNANSSDRLVMHKLKTEATNMINLNHRNVVKIYDIHSEDEVNLLDMEFIAGGDLIDLMVKNPDSKIPEERVWQLIIQIAKGMQAIHDVSMIHQDLKPENILLTKQGVVKITDFGISGAFKSSKSRIEESEGKRTFVYASPEQLTDENMGKESDVWSFGTMLYHILTGENLYSGTHSNDVLLQINNREFKSIPDLSTKMNALLTKCLKREYQQRFRDFDKILEFIDSKDVLQTQNKIKEGFVFVEGGTFQMGSNDYYNAEKPVHGVTLSDFYIGKYPVTQAEYQLIMGKRPSRFSENNSPVEQVSWYDAVEFCNKKSRKDGFDPVYSGSEENIKCDFTKNGYRLPTEAEWEYAARGGDKSKGYKFSGSDDINEVAEYDGNKGKSAKPVGGRKPNELGIYDMSGNVWEWCNDWFDSYNSGAQTDPAGPTLGSYRVYRGGSWIGSAAYCRVAGRLSSTPSYSGAHLGFRLAYSAK